MARAIGEADLSLSVWARRPQSLAVLDGVPHRVCNSVEELAATCEIVGLCLRDDNDVEDVLISKGLARCLKEGSVVVNHGTGLPSRCREWDAQAQRHGARFLDAPVSGGRHAAKAKTLTTMVGGEVSAFVRCVPVFSTFASKIVHLGGPGSGQLAKLLNNVLFAANLKNVADFMELLRRLNLDQGRVVDLVLTSSGGSFALETFTHHMQSDLADHYGAMIGKDLSYFSQTARGRDIPVLPLEQQGLQGVQALADALKSLVGTRNETGE